MINLTEENFNLLTTKVDNIESATNNNVDRLDLIDGANVTLKSYVEATRSNDDHLSLASKLGEKISGNLFGTALVNYPTGIKVIAPGVAAVVCYYQRLITYTSEFAIDSVFPTTYQNPTASNEGIAYSFGFDIAPNGDVAIASWARHIVRVYDSVGALKFTIGIPNSLGNVADGKLRNPKKAIFLPNGNILVSSYYGFGENGTNHGHLTEYSGTDGSLVATRMVCNGTLQSAIGSNVLYRPTDMDWDKTDSNLLWVCEYGRGQILLINTTTWLVEDIYYPPSGYTFGIPWGVASLSDGNIAVASKNAGVILIIDRDTKELVSSINPADLGAGNDFRDVKELEAGKLIFTDWTNKACYVANISDRVDIAYDIPALPEGSTLSSLNYPNFDSSTGILSQHIAQLETAPDKLPVLYTREA